MVFLNPEGLEVWEKARHRAGKIRDTPEPVVVSNTLEDKPSLSILSNFTLGDMRDLQKWLVTFAVQLHSTGSRDQRSRKLVDV